MDFKCEDFFREFAPAGTNKLSVFRNFLESDEKDPEIKFNFEEYPN